MDKNLKQIPLSVLKFIVTSIIAFLVIGPLSFFVEGVNNPDNSYAFIATVKSIWAFVAQTVAAFAAVFLFRIRGGSIDSEIARGRMKEKPLTFRESTRYILQNGKTNITVFIAFAAVALIISVIAGAKEGGTWLEALYYPMFCTKSVVEYIFGYGTVTRIVGQLFGTATFVVLYTVVFYITQKRRFNKFNNRIIHNN